MCLAGNYTVYCLTTYNLELYTVHLYTLNHTATALYINLIIQVRCSETLQVGSYMRCSLFALFIICAVKLFYSRESGFFQSGKEKISTST